MNTPKPPQGSTPVTMESFEALHPGQILYVYDRNDRDHHDRTVVITELRENGLLGRYAIVFDVEDRERTRQMTFFPEEIQEWCDVFVVPSCQDPTVPVASGSDGDTYFGLPAVADSTVQNASPHAIEPGESVLRGFFSAETTLLMALRSRNVSAWIGVEPCV